MTRGKRMLKLKKVDKANTNHEVLVTINQVIDAINEIIDYIQPQEFESKPDPENVWFLIDKISPKKSKKGL